MSLADTTAHTCIRSLPRELLAIVFDFYVFDAPADSPYHHPLFQIGHHPPQLVLMKVCKFWWIFCVSLPALWRSITIGVCPKRDIAPGSVVWDQFANVCKSVLELSGPLSLEVELLSWHLNDESIQTVCGMGLDERVSNDDELANRILQLAIAHCKRWKTFVLRGCAEDPDECGVPQTQLMKVAHRIPKLREIQFDGLWWIPPPSLPQPNFANILLDAPCLSFLTVAKSSCLQYLNIPWSQLRLATICIDISWLESYPQFADYFSFIMTQTTARCFIFHDSSNGVLEDTNSIRVTYPMTENPHVKFLGVGNLVLPPIRLPNLTRLEVCVGKRVDEDPFGVAQIESLLKKSRCHLLDLAIYDCAEDTDWQSIVPLCPYLNNLRFLRFYGASPLNDQTTVTYFLQKLCDLLASPANLPNLTTLAFKIIFSPSGEPQNTVHRYVFDDRLAGAVWDIVQARMLGEWCEVKLEVFRILLNFPKTDVIELDYQQYVESLAAQSIAAADVDFKFIMDTTGPFSMILEPELWEGRGSRR